MSAQTERSNSPAVPKAWKPNDPPSPFLVRAADRLYRTVRLQIQMGRIDARSEVGDAALDYRDERDEMARRRDDATR